MRTIRGLAAIALLLVPGTAESQDGNDRFVLQQVRTIPTTHFEFQPQNIWTSNSDSRIALSGLGGLAVLNEQGELIAALRTKHQPIAIRLVTGRTEIEFIDAASHEMLTMSFDGRVLRRRAIRIDHVVTTGAFHDGTWYLAGIQRGSINLYAVAGQRLANAGSTTVPASLTDGARIWLTPANKAGISPKEMLVSLAAAPYTVYGLDLRSRAVRNYQPLERDSALARFWLAMPPVVVDSVVVQSFADVRSDIRAHVIYMRGKRVACKIVDAPLAFIGASNNRLFAGRYSGEAQLVEYRIRHSTTEGENNETSC